MARIKLTFNAPHHLYIGQIQSAQDALAENPDTAKLKVRGMPESS
jgi:hypothetical protein